MTWKNIKDAEDRENAAKKQELDAAEQLMASLPRDFFQFFITCLNHFTDFANCFQIKARGLIEVALDAATVSIVDELFDAVDIYEPARLLQTLNLSSCFELTDRGICDVLGSVRGLKHLLLDGCEHISSAAAMAAAIWHGSRLGAGDND